MFNRRGFLGVSAGAAVAGPSVAQNTLADMSQDAVGYQRVAGSIGMPYSDPTLRLIRDAGGIPDWLEEIWRQSSKQIMFDSDRNIEALRSISPVAKQLILQEKAYNFKRSSFLDMLSGKSLYKRAEHWMEQHRINLRQWF